jgi:hypothetical protein
MDSCREDLLLGAIVSVSDRGCRVRKLPMVDANLGALGLRSPNYAG